MVGLIVYVANGTETQLLRRPKELAPRPLTGPCQWGLPGRGVPGGQGEDRPLGVPGLTPARGGGLSPGVSLLWLAPLWSLLPLHAGRTQAVEYPEHLLSAHAAALCLCLTTPPLGPASGALSRMWGDGPLRGARESRGGDSPRSGRHPVVGLPRVEAALAESIMFHAEREEAARHLALHGVGLAVQAEAGGRGRGRAGARQHRPPSRGGGRRRRAADSRPPGAHLDLRRPTLRASSFRRLHHPFYPGYTSAGGGGGLPLLEALVAVGLRVYGHVEGAARRGAANLDEGELGDGEGRRALRLGGPRLLLVLLPALVLVVDQLQVVLHQVHVLR